MRDETERPTEWLRKLAEQEAPYADLLASSGSLAVAAYRLARARCRVRAVAVSVPSAAELRVAAFDIAEGARLLDRRGVQELVMECEEAGLAVIAPVKAA